MNSRHVKLLVLILSLIAANKILAQEMPGGLEIGIGSYPNMDSQSLLDNLEIGVLIPVGSFLQLNVSGNYSFGINRKSFAVYDDEYSGYRLNSAILFKIFKINEMIIAFGPSFSIMKESNKSFLDDITIGKYKSKLVDTTSKQFALRLSFDLSLSDKIGIILSFGAGNSVVYNEIITYDPAGTILTTVEDNYNQRYGITNSLIGIRFWL